MRSSEVMISCKREDMKINLVLDFIVISRVFARAIVNLLVTKIDTDLDLCLYQYF